MVLVVVDWGIHEFYISVQFLYIAINFTKQQRERISSRALDIKGKTCWCFHSSTQISEYSSGSYERDKRVAKRMFTTYDYLKDHVRSNRDVFIEWRCKEELIRRHCFYLWILLFSVSCSTVLQSGRTQASLASRNYSWCKTLLHVLYWVSGSTTIFHKASNP